jgi:hypothetical protein
MASHITIIMKLRADVNTLTQEELNNMGINILLTNQPI